MSHNNSSSIDQVLESLEGIQRAKAPGFMYTRIQSRMEKEFDQVGLIGRWLTRPALTLSLAAIILIANVTTVFQMMKQNSATPAADNSPVVASVDYAVGAYAVYDENPIEP